MANIEDTILAVQEQIVNDLIAGGPGFRGIGPMAKFLVMAAATGADENAKALYGDRTVRTSEDFATLSQRCQMQFIKDILGFGDADPMTPQDAGRKLVEEVYDAYIVWAKEG